MIMSMKTLLNEEIENEFKLLGKMQPGTEEYKTTVDGLTKLVDRAIEIDKANNENREKIELREFDEQFRLIQTGSESRDRLIKNCIAIAGIVIPSVITIWGTVKSIEFEKEGTITTIMGRGFINKLLPKKWY